MEFIELQNVGNAPVSIKDYHFSNGVHYTFGDVTLAVGAYIVVARDPTQQTW